ncbi:anion permease [Trichocoleus desertorum AS-A10]|uniref:inorganic phosphate transporter n=1 Tax=Trichocoleus desertorum TaxID=1481672 RepID=UPI00329A6B87
MLLFVLFLATCFLAYSNGANDNFKGVATLFGSKTTSYKVAIAWATLTTFLGSICSIFLAATLLKNFSGKGLVPDAIASAADFHLSVALGAGITVILATFTGFPISTTHGLTGALVGAGLVAIGSQVNFGALGSSFLLPLLVSPVLAIVLGSLLYGLFRTLRVTLGIKKEWCLCVGETQQVIPIPQPDATNLLKCVTTTDIAVDSLDRCTQRYTGKFLGVRSQQLINALHFVSAGTVSFARGLNDTPKIVSLLLVGQAFSVQWGMLAVGLGMAIGGLINAKKVAITMSQKITNMNAGQGFSANLVTAALVIAASRYGLPVSTTHVSVGSIFGGGLISRQANWQVFYQILLSWILTLPIAASISAGSYLLLHR